MKHSHPARAWLASRDNLASLWDAAAHWYKTPKRHYHTAAHANAVAQRVLNLGHNESELLLAARWHDAVYVPGAPEGVNEQASAAALAHTAKVQKLDTSQLAIVAQACALILQTRMSMHLTSLQVTEPLTATLLDADLASLAADYSGFAAHQRHIIWEQTGVKPTAESMAAASAWLTSFLSCRDFIFHTDTGRSIMETLSRDNIARFAREHGAQKLAVRVHAGDTT